MKFVFKEYQEVDNNYYNSMFPDCDKVVMDRVQQYATNKYSYIMNNDFWGCRGIETYNAFMSKCYKLLTSKLRSNFRISLRNNLLTWCEGKSEYYHPFTKKQLEFL